MKKRLIRTPDLSALTLSIAVPTFAAEPFSDVPQDHWAYSAVSELADAGLVTGYEDGTFGGDRTVTRYEMAQMVDNLLQNDTASEEQKAMIDRLAAEFSDEIDTLHGDVDEVKAEQERVKFSGDTRLRYAALEDNGDKTDYRARIGVDGKVSDKVTFSARIASEDTPKDNGDSDLVLDTANVGLSVLGLDTTIGRQDLTLGTGTLIDDTFNGIAATKGGFTAFYGKYDGENMIGDEYKDTLFGAEFTTGIGVVDITLDYMKADDSDKEFYGANTEIGLGSDFALNAEFLKEDDSGDKALGYGIRHAKSGLSVSYKDVEKGAFTNFGKVALDLNTGSFADGFKGVEYGWEKDFNDNVMLNVVYQDFEKQDGTALDGRTAATVSLRF